MKIKTAKEFLDDVRYQEIESNKQPMICLDEETLINLFKRYAEQFINLAAEKATTIDIEGSFFSKGEYETHVDRKSILNVKKKIS